MRGANILEVNYHHSLISGASLGVQLICECDLYAKIYGKCEEHFQPDQDKSGGWAKYSGIIHIELCHLIMTFGPNRGMCADAR